MKRLFIVGAKLLGLSCLWWAILTTLQIISYSTIITSGFERDSHWLIGLLFYGGGLLAYFVLAVCFAFILLFRTEWLAEKVGIQEDGELPGWPEEHKLLNLGIMLLGLYVLAHAIPGLIKSLLTGLGSFFAFTQPVGYRETAGFFQHFIISAIGDILKIVLGFLLILMPAGIIRYITRWQGILGRKLTKPQVDENASEGQK